MCHLGANAEGTFFDSSVRDPRTRQLLFVRGTSCLSCSCGILALSAGDGHSSVVERRTRDGNVADSYRSLWERREIFLLQGQLFVLTLFGVRVCVCAHARVRVCV